MWLEMTLTINPLHLNESTAYSLTSSINLAKVLIYGTFFPNALPIKPVAPVINTLLIEVPVDHISSSTYKHNVAQLWANKSETKG